MKPYPHTSYDSGVDEIMGGRLFDRTTMIDDGIAPVRNRELSQYEFWDEHDNVLYQRLRNVGYSKEELEPYMTKRLCPYCDKHNESANLGDRVLGKTKHDPICKPCKDTLLVLSETYNPRVVMDSEVLDLPKRYPQFARDFALYIASLIVGKIVTTKEEIKQTGVFGSNDYSSRAMALKICYQCLMDYHEERIGQEASNAAYHYYYHNIEGDMSPLRAWWENVTRNTR